MTKLINEADKKYFEIYSKKEAELHEVAVESVENLKEGEKTRKYFCLKYNGNIAAFVSFYKKNNQTVWISMLFTDPAFQGKGYASKLLNKVEQIARKSKVKVIALKAEPKAKWVVNFYLKNGYRVLSKTDLKKFSFDKVTDKDLAPNRYVFGKIL